MPVAKYRHYGCRISDQMTYKGMRTVFLENEMIRIGILLDKGADIFQFLHKPTDTDFLWRSPQGLIQPDRFTPTVASSAGSFLDYFHGGWQEILPGGGPTRYRGAEIGLHGEVTLLGWDFDILEDTPEAISVKLTVECVRTPFRLERVMRLITNNPTLFIDETLTNLSNEAQEFMWGHHPTFGAPFLREGLRLIIPATTGLVHEPRFSASGIFEPGSEFEWPFLKINDESIDLSFVPSQAAGYADLVYLSGLISGWYAILDQEKRLGFGLAWPKDIFPYLWFWLVYGKAPGFPWWDRVYCIALEPWTSIPNDLDQAIKTNTQAMLKGGEQHNISLAATVFTGLGPVNHIGTDGVVS